MAEKKVWVSSYETLPMKKCRRRCWGNTNIKRNPMHLTLVMEKMEYEILLALLRCRHRRSCRNETYAVFVSFTPGRLRNAFSQPRKLCKYFDIFKFSSFAVQWNCKVIFRRRYPRTHLDILVRPDFFYVLAAFVWYDSKQSPPIAEKLQIRNRSLANRNKVDWIDQRPR